jgi:hypothetical protein
MIHFLRMRILRISFLVIFSGAEARAQVNTAELYGSVRDPSENSVPGTRIKVQNLETGLTRTTLTREDGSYSFLGLRPGAYSVYVEASGFCPVEVKEVVLTVGQRAELSFRLEVNPVMEAIEILSKTQLLESSRTSVATTIVERLIKDLPSRTRDAFNFTLLDSAASRENQASLPPIPATGLNIEGQQTRANMVTIDGVDAIDSTINGVRITIPQDAVQEFQILKSGYNAEHGRSSAAVINIVSREGGARAHGDLFGLLRSRHVSASDPFAGEPGPGDTNTQAGFTLGGPLRKSTTFFFIGFDTTQENSIGVSTIGQDNFGFVEIQNPYGLGSVVVTPEQAQFIQSVPVSLSAPYSAVADRAARTALFGNSPGGPKTFGLIANPLPLSFTGLKSQAGNYKTTQDSYVQSSRLDHTFGGHGLFLRIGSSSSDTLGRTSNSQTQADIQNAFSRTNNLFVRDLSLTAQLSSSFGSAWLNEVRFQYGRRGLGLRANSKEVAVEIPGAASIGAEPFAPADRVEKRWQMSNSLSRLRASHAYKAGVDVNIISAVATFPLNQAGLYSFPTTLSVDFPLLSAVLGSQLTAALKGAGAPGFSAVQLYGMGLPESFVQQFGGSSRATAHYRNTTLGMFFQDTWKIAANLLLNWGVRYDAEYPSRRAANSSLFQQSEALLGVGQQIPRDDNNVGPRFGFSWDPFKKGATVVRGSYGVYYGHPLTALSFLADIVDGAESPFVVVSQLTGVEDLFQAAALTPIGSRLLDPRLGYQRDQQRYDPLSAAFLSADSALLLSPILPTSLPIERRFRYTSSQQATFGMEREFPGDWAVSADYTFLRALHIPRPRNINQGNFGLIADYERAARLCPALPDVSSAGCANPIYNNAGGPLAGLWDTLGGNGVTSLAPFGQLIFNQFRASGPNYAYAQTLSGGGLSKATLDNIVGQFGLHHAANNQFVPFFNVKQYEASASSFYQGLTMTVRKRMSRHYQLLGSWTWSHSIDGATDIETFEEPQDNSNNRLDRGNSNFDQRHRLVLSGVHGGTSGEVRRLFLERALCGLDRGSAH